jgi:hypothetical protein
MHLTASIHISAALGATVVLALTPFSHARQNVGEGAGGGADAALCQLFNTRSWGRVGDIHAYSIQTDTWNNGDENLVWQEFTPLHPIMAQNIFRYRDGRIEQIGLSWIKHGFCALQQAGCGPCGVQTGCLDFLGVGCRDPYSANLNGNQMRLGPRSEVDASSASFPYPFTLGWQQTGDLIFKRIQIHDDDLNPALNPGALYYIEGHILHAQEGTSSLRHNNATHEQVTPVASGDTYNLGTGFGTVQHQPAIYAWQTNDAQVDVQTVDIPGDGRFIFAQRVFDNGDGTWRYEYAVHNLNSHRSGQAFSIPLGNGADVLATFHRDVKYHSGEVYTNEDWTLDAGDDAVTWSGQTFAANPNANALRWGTMFNFSVTTDTPPTAGNVTLSLFRPGDGGSVQIAAQVPSGAPTCPADLTGDGVVDVDDLHFVIDHMGPCPVQGACPADLNGDGRVSGSDVAIVAKSFGPCD